MNRKNTIAFLEIGILSLIGLSTMIPVWGGNLQAGPDPRPLMPWAALTVVVSLHFIVYALVFDIFRKYAYLIWGYFVALLTAIVLWNLAWCSWLDFGLWQDWSDPPANTYISVDKAMVIFRPIVYDAFNFGAMGRVWALRNLSVLLSVVFLVSSSIAYILAKGFPNKNSEPDGSR